MADHSIPCGACPDGFLSAKLGGLCKDVCADRSVDCPNRVGQIKVRKVEPIAGKKTPAFVERSDGSGGLEMVDFFSYPPNPRGKALRDARVAAGVTFGQAARAAGLRPSEWCGLERGSYTTDDWDRAFAVVKEASHA